MWGHPKIFKKYFGIFVWKFTLFCKSCCNIAFPWKIWLKHYCMLICQVKIFQVNPEDLSWVYNLVLFPVGCPSKIWLKDQVWWFKSNSCILLNNVRKTLFLRHKQARSFVKVIKKQCVWLWKLLHLTLWLNIFNE